MSETISKIENKILMQEHTSQQILGVFLLCVSAVNIIEALSKSFVRYIYSADPVKAGTYQNYLAYFKLLVVAVIYFNCLIRMKKLYFHSPYVRKLLFIWGVILIPIQLICDISTLLYNRLLDLIWMILSQTNVDNYEALYALFYDSSHGFKYMGMFIAVVIGIVLTGVILERRNLIIISTVLMTVFMVLFAAINMRTASFDILSINIGVNFTSVLFHSLMTIGLFILGVYIFKSYRQKEISL